MKRLIVYLFIFLGLALTFSVNSKETYGTIRVPSIEKCNSFSKGDTNWYFNNCDQLGSLKSGIKINKEEKVEYLKSNNTAYWQFMQFKINDLRGDGIVFYNFDVDKYYRINEKYEVVEKGSYKFKKDKKIYELTTQEKKKFLFKISIASQVVDIKSKVYDYKGYRRYQLVLADTNEQEQIRSSIKNFENNQYVKVDSNQGDNLKSGIKIDKSKKVKFTDCSKKKGDVMKEGGGMDKLGASFFFRSSKINDLRGDGVVYYKFRDPWVNNSRYYLHGSAEENEYHRLDKNYKIISQGTFKCTANKNVFELTEDNQKFLWKVSVPNQIVDIKSKIYDYKGYRRYQFVLPTNEDENLIYKAVNDHKNNNYAKADSNQDDNLKSGIEINKDEKVKYTNFDGHQSQSTGGAYFFQYASKINDLRGDGIVYYRFDPTIDNKGIYYRLNKDHKVISTGSFKYKKDKKVFELNEDDQKFLWKVSTVSSIIDIKSKVYDYKGYRRYQFVTASPDEQHKLNSSVKNYEENKYVKVETKQNDINDVSLKSALDIDKKRKVKYITYIFDQVNFLGYTFLIDDLRGNGPVYYKFEIDQYHRLDKDFNVISKGTYEFTGKDPNVVIKLKEGDLKFQWKISVASQVIDIKSKFYKYKGFKRFRLKKQQKNNKRKHY